MVGQLAFAVAVILLVILTVIYLKRRNVQIDLAALTHMPPLHWAALIAGCVVLLYAIFTIEWNTRSKPQTLTIVATGDKNELSPSNQVVIRSIRLSDGSVIDLSDLMITGPVNASSEF